MCSRSWNKNSTVAEPGAGNWDFEDRTQKSGNRLLQNPELEIRLLKNPELEIGLLHKLRLEKVLLQNPNLKKGLLLNPKLEKGLLLNPKLEKGLLLNPKLEKDCCRIWRRKHKLCCCRTRQNQHLPMQLQLGMATGVQKLYHHRYHLVMAGPGQTQTPVLNPATILKNSSLTSGSAERSSRHTNNWRRKPDSRD